MRRSDGDEASAGPGRPVQDVVRTTGKPDPPAPGKSGVAVSGEIAAVRTELGRVDAKASTLLALVGAGLAVAAAIIPAQTEPRVTAAVLLWISAGFAGVSIVLLLLSIRPVLSRADFGFPSYARSGAGLSLPSEEADARRLDELSFLSGLLVGKYRLVRFAVDALLAALGVLLAAVVALAL